jgi:hypothetical protein
MPLKKNLVPLVGHGADAAACMRKPTLEVRLDRIRRELRARDVGCGGLGHRQHI